MTIDVFFDLFNLVVVFRRKLVFINFAGAVEVWWDLLTNLFEVVYRGQFDFTEHAEATLLARKLIPKSNCFSDLAVEMLISTLNDRE